MSYRYVIIDETHEWWVGQCVIRAEHLGPALPDPVAVAQDRLRAALWAAPWPSVSTSVPTDPL